MYFFLAKPALIAGDLNVAYLDIDIWNVDAPHIPKSAATTPEERGNFQSYFTSKGITDTFRQFHSDATG